MATSVSTRATRTIALRDAFRTYTQCGRSFTTCQRHRQPDETPSPSPSSVSTTHDATRPTAAAVQSPRDPRQEKKDLAAQQNTELFDKLMNTGRDTYSGQSTFGRTENSYSQRPPRMTNFGDRAASREMLNEVNKNLVPTPTLQEGLDKYLGPTQELSRLHCYATKHNTHVTLTDSNRNPLISISCGNLGFRKAARGTYEAAFQTSAWVMRKMYDSGLLDERNPKHITRIEVVLRGFAEGRQAFQQALMGIEGRNVRGKVVRVSDATRIAIGGARAPNPRRLG